jgi:hypothetical protein
MERKEIRKILKKWVAREQTEYNHIWHTFVDISLRGEKMSKQFESLVDEVYNMQRKEEKT